MGSYSEGELRVWYYLWWLGIASTPQKTYDGLVGVGGHPLRYDFYVHAPTPFLLEFNGVQHFYPNVYSSAEGGGLGLDTDGLLHMENYHRKVMYAYTNNVYLLQIPMGLRLAVEVGMIVDTIALCQQVEEQRTMALEDHWLWGRALRVGESSVDQLSDSRRRAIAEIRSGGVAVDHELGQLEGLRRKKQKVEEELVQGRARFETNVEMLNRLREQVRIQNRVLVLRGASVSEEVEALDVML